MSTETATARTMGCAACGAKFPIARLEAIVVCPFCEQRQPMPEVLLRELGGFRQQFSAEQTQADAAAQHAQGWRDFSRTHRPVGKGTVFFLQAGLIGPILLGVLTAKVFPNAGVAPWAVGITGFGAVLGVLLLRGRFRTAGRREAARRRQPTLAELGVHQISCPACGAPNPYDPRRENTPCAHCNGALFPSGAVLRQSLDAARLGKRNALLEKYRAERAGTAQLALQFRASRSGPLASYKGAIGLTLAAGAILVAATRDFWDEGAPFRLMLLTFWALLPLPFLYVWRRQQRERALRSRLEAALELVARQGRGVVDDEVAEYIAWLDRHWAGAYEVPYVDLGAWFQSVRVTAGPYPSLIELNLDPRGAAGGSVKVLLAAWVPGVSDAEGPLPQSALPASARPFVERLLELGWSVKVTAAGLVAAMDLQSAAVQSLLREPESATGLTSVLAHVAGLGRCLHAV